MINPDAVRNPVAFLNNIRSGGDLKTMAELLARLLDMHGGYELPECREKDEKGLPAFRHGRNCPGPAAGTMIRKYIGENCW